jgi:hypothetical protein
VAAGLAVRLDSLPGTGIWTGDGSGPAAVAV